MVTTGKDVNYRLVQAEFVFSCLARSRGREFETEFWKNIQSSVHLGRACSHGYTSVNCVCHKFDWENKKEIRLHFERFRWILSYITAVWWNVVTLVWLSWTVLPSRDRRCHGKFKPVTLYSQKNIKRFTPAVSVVGTNSVIMVVMVTEAFYTFKQLLQIP
jgi:hypothetical protein